MEMIDSAPTALLRACLPRLHGKGECSQDNPLQNQGFTDFRGILWTWNPPLIEPPQSCGPYCSPAPHLLTLEIETSFS